MRSGKAAQRDGGGEADGGRCMVERLGGDVVRGSGAEGECTRMEQVGILVVVLCEHCDDRFDGRGIARFPDRGGCHEAHAGAFVGEHPDEDSIGAFQVFAGVHGGLRAEFGVIRSSEVVEGLVEKPAVLGKPPHGVNPGELVGFRGKNDPMEFSDRLPLHKLPLPVETNPHVGMRKPFY